MRPTIEQLESRLNPSPTPILPWGGTAGLVCLPDHDIGCIVTTPNGTTATADTGIAAPSGFQVVQAGGDTLDPTAGAGPSNGFVQPANAAALLWTTQPLHQAPTSQELDLYFGGVEVAKSLDGGQTWSAYTPPGMTLAVAPTQQPAAQTQASPAATVTPQTSTATATPTQTVASQATPAMAPVVTPPIVDPLSQAGLVLIQQQAAA